MKRAILLNVNDNVATALEPILCGEHVEILVDGQRMLSLTVRQDIPKYFKIAMDNLRENQNVFKYGEVIGKTNHAIVKGDLVHVDELRSFKV